MKQLVDSQLARFKADHARANTPYLSAKRASVALALDLDCCRLGPETWRNRGNSLHLSAQASL